MNHPAVMPDMTDADARLRGLIRESPFPLFQVRLSDGELLEVSRPLETWAERSRTELIGMRVLDYVADPEKARLSLTLLATGVIDAYSRHALYKHPSGSTLDFEVRFAAYTNESPRRTAVAMILPGASALPADALEAPPMTAEMTVLGTVDAQWTIDRVTSDATELLGYASADILGRSAVDLVHPEDVSCLLLLAAHSGEGAPSMPGTCGRLRIRTARGDWILCRVALHPLAGQAALAFAFAVTPITTDIVPEQARARELEEHLRRIAREIAASGVASLSRTMPTSIELPELSRLTSREYEIVVRLASGDRVPAIARGLFLSESTVRNHLTSVFRKFGVHSQHDLMARLHAIG
jgi:PAS domain S-box-containing protein